MMVHSQSLQKKSRAATLLLATALCAFASLAGAKQLLHNIELQWRPSGQVMSGKTETLPSGLTVQIGTFNDKRDHKELIGENREDADDGTILPVSTVTDVPDWIAKNLKEILRQNGMNVVDSGAPVVLDGDVQRFFVVETNTYQADVALHLRLRDTSGATLWETSLSANESRFGRSYKKENYCELLSDTLIGMAHSLINNAQFRDAIANGAHPQPKSVDNGPTATDPIIE